MKTVVTVMEVENEGLEAFLGKPVTLFCANYIYAGILLGVNNTFVKLDEAKIVYETGGLSESCFKQAESFHSKIWYVQTNAIESFGPGK